jgi:basic membrane protein A
LLAAAVVAGVALVAGVAASGTAPRPLRIGLVFQNTSVDDPYQKGVLLGFRRAARLPGVEARTIASSPTQSSLGAFRYLAKQRYDLILTYGFNETHDLDTAARLFPDQKFAIVDAPASALKHNLPNVHGGIFKTEQAGYLAGYLAALLERRREGRDVLGSVGGYPIPTVDAYIAGYQAGARKADPGIRLLNGYAYNFAVRARCKAVALDQIARGAGAIFQVADFCGRGALAAAKQNGIWGIGVDVDQASLGPHILTSVVKHLDVAVFDVVKAFRDGKLRFGVDSVFDLANGGVGLGKFSRRVPRDLIARLEPIRRQIVSGRIKVPARLGTA